MSTIFNTKHVEITQVHMNQITLSIGWEGGKTTQVQHPML